MHVRKAYDELRKLTSAPANLDTLTKAEMLLDGLARENMDPYHIEAYERPNETVNSKLRSARGWFEILCGVGEDGGWTEEQIRDTIRTDLSGAAMHILDDGIHFKCWSAIETSGPANKS